MSDKLIRDELLRSHRYVSLSNDTTKLLFLHLMLSSDSLSNAEATSTALTLAMGRHISETAGSALLSELADHDLIRLYDSDGKRYCHIPRSRQRIRYLNGKHPRPPVSVEDIGIKDLISKVGLKSDRGQTSESAVIRVASQQASQRIIKDLQAKVGPFTPEEKRSEEKKNKSKNMSESAELRDKATQLLTFLNAKAGRKFRPTPTTLKPIIARLKEFSYDECRAVIVRRWVAWRNDDKMRDYLRPDTLFNPTKFAQYIGDVPTPEEMESDNAN